MTHLAPPSSALRPLVVQSNGDLLLETAVPGADEARDDLLRFAELVKSPEHLHTYRASPLSLWNAAALGETPASILASLERHARYPVPASVRSLVLAEASRWGRLRLARGGAGGLAPGELALEGPPDDLALVALARRAVETVMRESASGMRDSASVMRSPETGVRESASGMPAAASEMRETSLPLDAGHRGPLKLALAREGHPVRDAAGFEPGAPLAVSLREKTLAGAPLVLRPYQAQAARAFLEAGAGTVVLPCGSGKTVVGLAAIAGAGTRTLVLAPGTAAARQWRDELLDKTTLGPTDLAELSSESRARGKADPALAPVTVAATSLLARSPELQDRLARADWGLLVLDEVHLLPATLLPFLERVQGRRRLGLTATLGRDGEERAREVFALVGPCLASVPWKVLEKQGWIAEALCAEVKVPLEPAARLAYLEAPPRERPLLAAENPRKLAVLEKLLARHAREPLLVLGSHRDLLEQAAALANAPLVSGDSRARERESLFREFRAGKIQRLVLSKVGSHAVDLPEATVAIQLSGTFGSRQEEAQRLGRVLRPKASGARARFYALVSLGTVEEEHAHRRQLFLTEQGYRYAIEDGLA